LLTKDVEITDKKFLAIPNATMKRIKALHEAHKKARTVMKEEG
jgi:hypothetical protein